ncbi:MAG: sigma-54-dependent Fis family transcriptional regulator [Deltaproteobacteria bacterium]|nr:sigma-54-dependent Fis family transcriptional regulator [Deltaproteobacteria bacterium]
MASFVLYPADLSAPVVVPVDRRIIRFGTAPDNDVVLVGGQALPHHAHLLYDKQSFTLTATDGDASVVVLGKAKKTHKLADKDVVLLGDHLLRFTYLDPAAKPKSDASRASAARALDIQRFTALHRFAQKLMATYDLDALLATLLDELIALTGADKAFLLLALDGRAKVHVARNVGDESLAGSHGGEEAVSDSIVSKVLETGEPLLVADALSHDTFKSSKSVMRLKLSSVMCVPLKIRGITLGAIYLGNDNAINHFSDDLVATVSVFAAEAGLVLENALVRKDLEIEVDRLATDLKDRRFGEIIGACDAMRDIYKKIARIATTDISVLIEGETGTGKELVARAIHQKSNRADKPFVVINCGAIPENLLESELFGHVRGAFTGAIATVQGRFQQAHGGTLFLDEIGEMPLSLQVKILRAIQERVVQKVGDTKSETVDIRVVAATNKRLIDEVRAGAFREDLYYRLNVVALPLPPLRERGEDIVLIARFFLSRYAPEILGAGKEVALSREATQALRRWRWPGNIRELENRIKKAIVFCDRGIITPADLDLVADGEERILPLAEAREVWQRDYINKVLALNDGNRTKTARDLDVDPRTIFRHLEKERGDG